MTEDWAGSDQPEEQPEMVDWALAVQTAKRFTKPGPQVSRDEAAEIVAELRAGAAMAEGHVRGYTGLATSGVAAPVVVIDRHGWVQANADGFQTLMRPLVDKLVEARGAPSAVAGALGARVTGLEVGALLGYLSGRVLGQFDPFWFGSADGRVDVSTPPVRAAATDGQPSDSTALALPETGRMLLVAPNIVHTERELDVNPQDFRLWVCLHEETHRVQFTAVPWLRQHLMSQVEGLVDATRLDPGALMQTLREGVARVARATKGEGGEMSLLDLVQTPAQREIVDRITALMSLLEGHADVVMDGVGPEVIGSVATIRKRFNERRKGGGSLDQMLRRLLGLEAKMRQYRDGATFVRGVLDQVGMEGFNRVWSAPNTLPTRAEITDPEAWVRRVHD